MHLLSPLTSFPLLDWMALQSSSMYVLPLSLPFLHLFTCLVHTCTTSVVLLVYSITCHCESCTDTPLFIPHHIHCIVYSFLYFFILHCLVLSFILLFYSSFFSLFIYPSFCLSSFFHSSSFCPIPHPIFFIFILLLFSLIFLIHSFCSYIFFFPVPPILSFSNPFSSVIPSVLPSLTPILAIPHS